MRSVLVAVSMFVLAGSVGCASFKGMAARHEYIESQAREFVFNKPAQEVWPAARQLLFEKGYDVKNTGEAGTLTAESEWKYEGGRRSRYLLQVNVVDPGHCRVIYTKLEGQVEFKNNDSTRDVGLEWELIQKVEPERATAIKTEAEKKGDEAKKAAS